MWDYKKGTARWVKNNKNKKINKKVKKNQQKINHQQQNKSTKKNQEPFKYPTLLEQMKDNRMKDILVKAEYDKKLLIKEQPLPAGGIDKLIKKFKKNLKKENNNIM